MGLSRDIIRVRLRCRTAPCPTEASARLMVRDLLLEPGLSAEEAFTDES